MTRRATWARALARAMAFVAAAGMLLGLPVPVVAHADDTIQLSLSLTSLTPSASKPKDKVSLRLTVTNTGTVPAYGVVAHLWRSRDAIHDQGNLATLASGGTTLGGWASGPGSYQLVTTSMTAFEPGATRDFTLTATLEQLGFDATSAAYAVGADVVATADQSSNNSVVAKVRTFMPVFSKTQVPVTSVIVLNSAPTKLAPNIFASDELSTELSARLRGLVDAAADPSVSWLVDPALLDEVRDQADGYQVLDGNTLREGTGQQVAADWLARYTKLDPARGGRTLFANPDTAGAAATKHPDLLRWSATATQGVTGLDGLPLVVLPSGLTVTNSSLRFLGTDAHAVLATNSRAPGSLQTTKAGLPLLSAQVVAELQPADVTGSIGQRQLLLAQAVIGGKAGQVRLITGPIGVAADATARTGWTTPRALPETLKVEPTTSADLETVKERRLSNDQFAVLGRLASDMATYNSLVPNSTIATQPDSAALRAVSSSWITNAAGAQHYFEALGGLFGREAVGDRVRLDVSSHLVMSARSNQFPVTVTNDGFEPIQVRVNFTTENPQRLTVAPSALVTVNPGQSETVNVRPEATGNGLVTARAQLSTADGRRIGESVPVTIEVTDLGIVAWIIVGVSGAVLVGATAWRIRQVRRRDAAAQTEPTEEP